MKYFEDSEFRCKDGCGYGVQQMDPRVLFFLGVAREEVNRPFILNSAVRCKSHNANVGGVANSEHVPQNTDSGMCTGVDISVPDSKFLYALLKSAFAHNVPRIGINFAKNFVHIGFSEKHPYPVLFKY